MDPGIDGSRAYAAEPSSVSSTLLYQIRARQPEAWQRLVHLYGPVVYRWCRQLGVGSADAADVVQEVFASVASGVQKFRRNQQEGSFGAWLRTITRHKVVDYFRRRKGRPNAEGGTNAYQQLLNQPESVEESSALTSRLDTDRLFARRVLDVVRAEFENTTWDAFWRIVVDGQSPAEVAESLGLTLAAVYKAKSRVLLRLRREVRDSME
jgi:RNA polymerase sigma-70 factor, ECF subfamily